ncbi:MAG: magnesium transporter [Bacteroidota bacterium]|nr:magnesium transporter [Bacteroidota bacterium]MDP4214695.1 magnesium transporter [Bacteroidota bacterium]MDP4244334.1 magnesium transporter [Bacteroidota bacterium]MDP4254900.1 magnesium transporter [Bacteroidota bacterium]MDP4258529.1 magnesium transporter [Bacteroidota bacterium]
MLGLNDIKNLLQHNKITEFVKLNKLTPRDIADFTNRHSRWAVKLFQHLDTKSAARAFKFVRKKKQEIIIKSLPEEKAAQLLNALQPDDRTAFLSLLPGNAVKELLKVLTPETRAETLKLLGYEEGSVGRLMTPDYLSIKASDTCQDVLNKIRKLGQATENLNFLFILDEKGVLIDDINIKDFLVHDPGAHVADLMDHQFIALNVNDAQTAAIKVFRNNSRFALPVTDDNGVLLGIVTLDDVLRLAEKEDTREMQKIGGSEALDEPYNTISLPRLIRKRAGWLIILFLGEMLTATAMGHYEKEISKAVVLALFIPLIISSGGNSGSQASSIIIRAMALGEVGFRDWWRVVRREIASGFILGIILGVVGFLRVLIWQKLGIQPSYGEEWFLVAGTVFFALIGVVMWGTLSGSMLPLVLKRCGADPAASSAPFVATLVDVTGLVIYFSVAYIIMHGKLL